MDIDRQIQEIFNRGPIACNVDAVPILNYTGGIVTAKQLGGRLSKGLRWFHFMIL